MAQTTEKSIHISITSTNHGKIRALLKHGQQPTINDFDRELFKEGAIVIKPFEKAFHKDGVYWIKVMRLNQNLTSDKPSFRITWRLDDTIPYLLPHQT
jgi:hypothetical protein